MENTIDCPPTDIDPYKALEIRDSASIGEVKSAYRRLALRYHPDKAQPDAKDAAHTKFQEIAFAYAILSDERRRKRYDTTGNIAESLDIEDDSFNWVDFFRAQWSEAVTGDRLNNFKATYQNSDEEKRDVLESYKSSKGKMNTIFKNVMLSNPLDDEDRFRAYIEQAIQDGEVEAYTAYLNESKQARERRLKRAREESEGAKEHAKKIGVYDSLFGDRDAGKARKKSKAGAGEPDLGALLQQRSKGRAATFLENLEAKYIGGKKEASGKMKEDVLDEPPDEAFQNTAARMKKRKTPVIEEDNDEEDVDLEDTVHEDDEARAKRKKPKRSKRLKI